MARFLTEDIEILLREGRNLLAFSAGVDSSALFHILLEAGIDFDMAFVNYGLRQQAKEEEEYAKRLARSHGKKLYCTNAPPFGSNFEARAGRFRYNFFEELIESHGYDRLLTAHQLNDRLEWFFMRMVRGAGTVELAGMAQSDERITKSGRRYLRVKPLLRYEKRELLDYLEERGYSYYIDESNFCDSYERNRFRERYGNPLIEEYGEGILRTLEYLDRDRKLIRSLYSDIYDNTEMKIVFMKEETIADRACDDALKRSGYLMSMAEREEVLRKESLVVGRRWSVERRGGYLFVAPYIQGLEVPKDFRERCRILAIPPKTRKYLYARGIEPESIGRILNR